MNKSLVFLFLSFWMFFTSCHPYQKYVEEIDLLLLSLDSTQAVFNQIDTHLVYQEKTNLKKALDSIKPMINDTSRWMKWQAYISPAANLNKSFSRWHRSFLNGKDEFSYSKKQLTDLRQDIQHKLLEESFIIKYVESEKQALEDLKQYTQKLKAWQQDLFVTSDSILPKLRVVQDTLAISQP